MPRNTYISQTVRSEQDLYEDLIIESLRIYGQETYYLPRTIVERDKILGEDYASRFDDAYMIESYIENTEGFEGQGDLLSKFGLEIRDEATFIISKKRWNQFVGIWNNEVVESTPEEGDIIYLPLTGKFFEIMHVEHELPFYQLSDLPVFKLRCSLFEYNEEQFETDIDEIDNWQKELSYQVGMEISIINSIYPDIGEVVRQFTKPPTIEDPSSISVYGEVQTIDKTSDTTATITVSNIGVDGIDKARDFFVSQSNTLYGERSTSTARITRVYNIVDEESFSNDAQARNTDFELEADNILDFTETNPFGDPSITN
jgi:hypothetical protein